ncbi:MAG: YraN family protein [Candidatus Paceibacterota bacterium]
MRETTTTTGRLGEAVAADFLRRHGYRIIGTNYRRPYGEIDIIARKDSLVFIEVKAVSCRIPDDIPKEGSDAHRPEENVGTAKRERLRRITETYLSSEVDGDPAWRFDLLCVYLDQARGEARIKWLDNIII